MERLPCLFFRFTFPFSASPPPHYFFVRLFFLSFILCSSSPSFFLFFLPSFLPSFLPFFFFFLGEEVTLVLNVPGPLQAVLIGRDRQTQQRIQRETGAVYKVPR